VLLPIYKNLQKEVAAFKPALLPNPEKEKLNRLEADKISTLISQTSQISNLKLVSSIPDINSLSKSGDFLSVSLKLLGDFLDIREFMTQLGTIPYIWHTEKVQVKSIPGAREFNLIVWFAVVKNGEKVKKIAAEKDKKNI
jgi:hypothetical protein